MSVPDFVYQKKDHVSNTFHWFDFGIEQLSFKFLICRPLLAIKTLNAPNVPQMSFMTYFSITKTYVSMYLVKET